MTSVSAGQKYADRKFWTNEVTLTEWLRSEMKVLIHPSMHLSIGTKTWDL